MSKLDIFPSALIKELMRKIKNIQKQEEILKEIILLNSYLNKFEDPYNKDIEQYYFIVGLIASSWYSLKMNIVKA